MLYLLKTPFLDFFILLRYEIIIDARKNLYGWHIAGEMAYR